MSDIAKYTSLKTVVAYFVDETGKSMGDFDKYWILAFRGLLKIGFNISFEPKTVRLPIEANQTAILPADYISWTKIGVLNSNYEVSTLKVNNSLTKLKSERPDRLNFMTPDVGIINQLNFAGYPFYVNYWYNGTYTPLFGAGNGLIQYGEVTVDETNRVIIMSNSFAFPDLILEYISAPMMDSDYQVETVCQEALIAFLKWKTKLAPREEFYAELTEARRSLKPIRLQEINQAIRETNGMKLKA
jgi:hypothetical protein